MRARARAILDGLPETTDADYDAQRATLSKAVSEHEIDEETAKALIEDIDLRQAARHTISET